MQEDKKKKHHGLFADYVDDEFEQQEDDYQEFLEWKRARQLEAQRRIEEARQGRSRAWMDAKQADQDYDTYREPTYSDYREYEEGRHRSGDLYRESRQPGDKKSRSRVENRARNKQRQRYQDQPPVRKKKRHPIRKLILFLLFLLIVYLVFSIFRGNVGKNVTNILLIGQDRREGESRERSDSMIIASINRKTREITLTSVMRDLYVPIPGRDKGRINEAYSAGGMKLLDKTIEENLDIKIDGNAEVDFDGFIKAMTSVGKLDINLKDYEADYLNVNSSYGGVENYAWNLHEGVNSLTPEQALAYSRIRYVGNSDWERTQRQRTVITTAFDKVKKGGPISMIRAAAQVLPSLTTDMSRSEIIGLASMVAMNRMDIGETYQVPFEGTYSNKTLDSGAEVLSADLDENARLLHDHIYGQ